MYALLRQQHGFVLRTVAFRLPAVLSLGETVIGRVCARYCDSTLILDSLGPGGKLTQPSGSPLYFKPNWLGAGSHLAALSSRFGAVRSNEPNSWRGLNPSGSVLVQQLCPVVWLDDWLCQ